MHFFKRFFRRDGRDIYELARDVTGKDIRQYGPLVLIVIGAIVVFALYWALFAPPRSFPVASVVTVEEGATLRDVAAVFKGARVIRSPFVFMLFARSFNGETGVIAGDYFFSRTWGVVEIARRVTSGEYGLAPTRVRIPEGSSTFDMAKLLAQKFGRFDAPEFLRLAQPKEGFLFPDTYFFLPNVEAPEVVRTLETAFDEQIAELEAEIEAFDRPFHDVVTMASLLEKEAHRTRVRRMISGILWRRLEIGMPLQVDATFFYINGKNTFELTLDDLRNNESPYNTYKFKGLPPGPIASPSLDSIRAAVTPIESNYLFYLADRGGVTHYAETFEEHIRNRRLYLD